MDQNTVERSIWISAPREQVWQSITNPEHIPQWFVPNLPGAVMTRDDSGKITVHMGPMGLDFAMLEIVEPQRQVTIRSLPDQLITASYTLEDQKGGTQVTVTARGFDSLSPDDRSDRVKLSGTGWEQALKNLKASIDGDDLPFPQAYTGPLFGYWREAQAKAGVERSIWIEASCERVWKAITDPKQLQAWFSPMTEWQLSSLSVGGRLFVQNPETNAEQYVEVIELLDAPYQLVTRTVPEPPDTVVKIKTYLLKEEKGGTRMSVSLVGYAPEAAETRWNHMEQDAVGFGMMLQNTKAYLEGKELPFPYGF